MLSHKLCLGKRREGSNISQFGEGNHAKTQICKPRGYQKSVKTSYLYMFSRHFSRILRLAGFKSTGIDIGTPGATKNLWCGYQYQWGVAIVSGLTLKAAAKATIGKGIA